MKRIVVTALMLSVVWSCRSTSTPPAAPAAKSPAVAQVSHLEKLKEGVEVAGLQAGQYGEIYFAGQPTDFAALATAGFRTVINLRTTTEYDEPAEAEAVRANGMTYVNVPFPGGATLTEEMLDSVTEQIKTHRAAGKLLVHCGSGNRVGLWAGGHFFKDHGLDAEQSTEAARRAGLRSEKLQAMLSAYLQEANK